ncbi:MAG: cation:proton antiporter [Ekhidna sp.]|uniref:cation:proton antiporter domain-containing protein n=1 Tax=Ekhidna sp. TaxID=2608089 RepID=UPI0032EB1EE0
MDLLTTYKEAIFLIIGFLIIAVASNQIAKTFQRIRLPLITGLIFAGIIAGPYAVGLIPISAKSDLNFINEIALAFIAFAAGAELYLVELRSKLRSIKIHSIVQSLVGLLMGAALVFFVIDLIPIKTELDRNDQIVISLLTAVLFLAPSPASVIAVISELRAKGPFTKTVLGVTMAKDFFVVILFAITLSISKSILGSQSFQAIDMLILLLEILASFALAFINGKLLQAILKFGEWKQLKTFLVLVLGYSNYAFSNFFKEYSLDTFNHEVYLEPLLICLIASFYISNYTTFRAEFLRILNDISLYIYVGFFTLTGASMDIPVLLDIWTVALLLFFIRLITLVIGTSFSNLLTNEKLKLYQIGWMPYVAQAGVALGLVTVLSNQFPSWGDDLATLCIAVIILNQLIGPPLIAKAITIMGENKNRAPVPEFDGVKDVLIFGHDNQSVALALQLKSKGWVVEIATQKSKGETTGPDDISFLHFKTIDKEFFKSINAEKYDAIVTLLSDDENLRICQLVYEEIGTKDIIVRLNDRNNKAAFLEYDVRLVDPSTAMVSLLDHFVRSPQATSLLLGLEEGKDSRDVTLRNSDLHGITLRELRLPSDVIVLSVQRAGNVIITHGYTRLRFGDVLTLVGSDPSLDQVQLKFDK